jgi:EAL domain-containing protein (putative c-di-GMP-specific phosphodiesterase class I)
VLLSDLERPEIADSIIREISKKLADPIEIDGQNAYITASLGISICPNDGIDAKELLLNADQAMYAAKAQDRNNYQYFTQSLQVKASYRAGIVAELRTSLAASQFELHYQPIMSLKTGKIVHAEALLRWRRTSGEIVAPSTFIEIAEESGLIVDIGDWVWKEALSFFSSLHAPHDFKFAINVSASQFNSNQHSVVHWLDLLRQYHVSPGSVVLEITERMMLMQSQRVIRKINMLQEAGCLFSVDDFGTGYSSLASLKNFNFDSIKIDMGFIKPLSAGTADATLVFAMISMAKALGLESIAEGVETEEQAELLRAMNCTYAQGYLFSKPLPGAEFKQLLLAQQ